jgi:hypothetical protein
MDSWLRVEVFHDGFDLSDGSEIFLLGFDDDFEGRVGQDFFADHVSPALVFIVVQVFGDELVFYELVLLEGHIELLGHWITLLRAKKCAIKEGQFKISKSSA